MTLIRVDLPAPFSPNSTWISPCARSKFTRSKANTPGKRFEISKASRSFGALTWAIFPKQTGGLKAAGYTVSAGELMLAFDALAHYCLTVKTGLKSAGAKVRSNLICGSVSFVTISGMGLTKVIMGFFSIARIA